MATYLIEVDFGDMEGDEIVSKLQDIREVCPGDPEIHGPLAAEKDWDTGDPESMTFWL